MDVFGPVWENYLDKIIRSWNNLVKDEDVVLLAGDLSWAMKLKDAKADIDYISKLKGRKIIIKGNHDYWWSSISKVRSILPPNFYALQNDSIKLGGVIFCGTRGWTFDNEKLKNRELLRLEMSLKDAESKREKKEPIICMLHYPPFEKLGTESEFTSLIEKYHVNAVIYGHLHGSTDMPLKCKLKGITYYLTSCDLLGNKLVQIYP